MFNSTLVEFHWEVRMMSIVWGAMRRDFNEESDPLPNVVEVVQLANGFKARGEVLTVTQLGEQLREFLLSPGA
jgi:hypothetical protein